MNGFIHFGPARPMRPLFVTQFWDLRCRRSIGIFAMFHSVQILPHIDAANPHRTAIRSGHFGSTIPGEKSGALQGLFMASPPEPATTSCFAASVGSPCSMSPSLSGVNHDLILCTECTMIYGLVVSFFKLQYVTSDSAGPGPPVTVTVDSSPPQ